jgi:uncharacterized protein YuzE
MALVTYDHEAMALYVKVSEDKSVNTVPLGEGAYLDISKDGKIIGLEIIFPRSTPQEKIDAIIGADESIKLFSKIFSNIITHKNLLTH